MFLCNFFNKDQHKTQLSFQNIYTQYQKNSKMRQDNLSPQMFGDLAKVLIRKSKYSKHLQECQQKRKNFIDPQFPHNQSSLGPIQSKRQIVWKRISQIIQKPVMIQNKIQPADIQQGNIGDCYFLAAVSSIAEVDSRIRKIFCGQMQLKKQGIYRFNVVEQGKLTEVFIDDYIPVYKGTDRPVFCKPNNNQVWVMLLQKLWAKISGSYYEIQKGYPHQVFNTLMLAPCFYHEIGQRDRESHQKIKDLWKILMQGQQNNFPMCAGSRQKNVCKGIKSRHTYSLLSCHNIKVKNNEKRLVKLRNPWGDTEYQGKYSQCDKQFWNSVQQSQKKKLLRGSQGNDGIFFLSLEQFMRNYQCVDISHQMSGSIHKREYGYNFETVQSRSDEQNFLSLNLQKDSKYPIYITVQKSFSRNQIFDQQGKIAKQQGYCQILIAKAQQDNKIFQYIGGKIESDMPDVSLKIESLPKGKYIILCQVGFPKQRKGEFTISAYTQVSNKLLKDIRPDQSFLHKLFTHHAVVINQNRQPLSQPRNISDSREGRNSALNSGFTSMMFDGKAGYGYLYTQVNQNSSNRIRITCDIRRIRQNGFYIVQQKINKDAEGDYIIEVTSQRPQILIFRTNLETQAQSLSFPPPGLKVKRII